MQTKATKQVSLVVLFVILHKVVPTFESLCKIFKYRHSMKATENYFPVVLLSCTRGVLTLILLSKIIR